MRAVIPSTLKLITIRDKSQTRELFYQRRRRRRRRMRGRATVRIDGYANDKLEVSYVSRYVRSDHAFLAIGEATNRREMRIEEIL